VPVFVPASIRALVRPGLLGVGGHIRGISSFHHSGFILEVYSVGCQ
jgi:hypothetical protein